MCFIGRACGESAHRPESSQPYCYQISLIRTGCVIGNSSPYGFDGCTDSGYLSRVTARRSIPRCRRISTRVLFGPACDRCEHTSRCLDHRPDNKSANWIKAYFRTRAGVRPERRTGRSSRACQPEEHGHEGRQQTNITTRRRGGYGSPTRKVFRGGPPVMHFFISMNAIGRRLRSPAFAENYSQGFSPQGMPGIHRSANSPSGSYVTRTED